MAQYGQPEQLEKPAVWVRDEQAEVARPAVPDEILGQGEEPAHAPVSTFVVPAPSHTA